MPTHIVLAPAKVNLRLQVLGKRDDGYHDIVSLVVFVDLCDTVAVQTGTPITTCHVTGCSAGLPDAKSNLAVRAAEALDGTVSIRIHKRIPVGAGLGGGSADAAAVLRAMGAEKRVDIAEKLGSDVPACLARRSVWITGRGEQLTPATDLPRFELVLVTFPEVSLHTASMYASLNRPISIGRATAPPKIEASLARLADLCANDFESLACERVPQLSGTLQKLADVGARAATITGKGPTAFGLFATLEDARAAANELRQQLREYGVQVIVASPIVE